MKRDNIIIYLLQDLKKNKIKSSLKKVSKNNTLFLEFLWCNHYIYGFQKYKNIIIVFLKYNQIKSSVICKQIQKKINIKNLVKQKKWAKNSFFILKTNSGLISINMAISKKIGGFLLYKFY